MPRLISLVFQFSTTQSQPAANQDPEEATVPPLNVLLQSWDKFPQVSGAMRDRLFELLARATHPAAINSSRYNGRIRAGLLA